MIKVIIDIRNKDTRIELPKLLNNLTDIGFDFEFKRLIGKKIPYMDIPKTKCQAK